MSLAALIAWAKANEALIATILFAISEAMGASPKVQSNGILSLILMQVKKYLKDHGGRDLTP